MSHSVWSTWYFAADNAMTGMALRYLSALYTHATSPVSLYCRTH